VPEEDFDLVVNLVSWANHEARPRRTLRLEGKVGDRKLEGWTLQGRQETSPTFAAENLFAEDEAAKVALLRNYEFRLPLTWLLATPGTSVSAEEATRNSATSKPTAMAPTSRLRLRFSLWRNGLPVDALPVEGWIELQLVSEAELGAGL